MTEPCYFVVERRLGRLSGSLYYDRLPTKYVGKRAREQGLHYAKRVDDQPHLAGLSRQQLFDAWEALGTLPDHKEVQLHGSEKLQTVAQLEARIAPLLRGHLPDVQGAVLAALLATWVLGHQDKEGRPAVLQLHMKYVRRLIDADAS